jgi:hypothetical protein
MDVQNIYSIAEKLKNGANEKLKNGDNEKYHSDTERMARGRNKDLVIGKKRGGCGGHLNFGDEINTDFAIREKNPLSSMLQVHCVRA